MRMAREFALVALLLVAVTAVVTWPQARLMASGVNDFGDPLLNSWTLAWVAHAIPTHPWRLLDANIFHPETGTLAYSEMLLAPALLAAPVLWAGGDPILAHNLVLVGGYVLSGLAMFVLVRSLTHHSGASVVAAVAFTVYPYRIESYGKVQLQQVFWVPLALWAIHRIAQRATIGTALMIGGLAAAQIYSCVYYGLYASPLLAIAGAGALMMTAPERRGRAAATLALGAAVALALTLPLAGVYRRAASVVGERTRAEVRHWSAQPADFWRAPADNALYGDPARPGPAERSLFPGFALPAVALAAFFPPAGGPAVIYAAAAVTAADLALGVNGWGYDWLYDRLPPLRAVRVPARFGMLLGLALAVLAGLGVSRLCRGRSRRARIAIAAAAAGLIVLESRPRPLDLSALSDRRPAVYAWLATQPDGVVCEYPVGPLQGRIGPQDPTYMYYSTRHWKPLVNGYSGFAPPSYGELLEKLRAFPGDEAIAYLRDRGVTYLLAHSPFYLRGNFDEDVRVLSARADLDALGRFPWRGGGVTAAFKIRPRASGPGQTLRRLN